MMVPKIVYGNIRAIPCSLKYKIEILYNKTFLVKPMNQTPAHCSVKAGSIRAKYAKMKHIIAVICPSYQVKDCHVWKSSDADTVVAENVIKK